jgi:hypothetical protein
VPFSKDVIFTVGPGAFADKRECVSTDFTYIWAVRGLDVEWIVLGIVPIDVEIGGAALLALSR